MLGRLWTRSTGNGWFGFRSSTPRSSSYFSASSRWCFPRSCALVYVAWVAIGTFVPHMTWMMYVTMVGLGANLLFGWCPLSRMIYLFPWNRAGSSHTPAFHENVFQRAKARAFQGDSRARRLAASGCSRRWGGLGCRCRCRAIAPASIWWLDAAVNSRAARRDQRADRGHPRAGGRPPRSAARKHLSNRRVSSRCCGGSEARDEHSGPGAHRRTRRPRRAAADRFESLRLDRRDRACGDGFVYSSGSTAHCPPSSCSRRFRGSAKSSPSGSTGSSTSIRSKRWKWRRTMDGSMRLPALARADSKRYAISWRRCSRDRRAGEHAGSRSYGRREPKSARLRRRKRDRMSASCSISIENTERRSKRTSSPASRRSGTTPRAPPGCPVLHSYEDGWHFTTLFSNTDRAHELGRVRDWVVVYFERDGPRGPVHHRHRVPRTPRRQASCPGARR